MADVITQQALPAQAVLLLTDGLKLTPEAQGVLQHNSWNAKPLKLKVVCVVGPAREGKSSLMNLLLREWGAATENEQFGVGSTAASHTKGVWMWSRPVPVPGTDHHLVLLDVEGCNAADRHENITRAIHCITYSISSVFMWNRMRQIDNSFLEEMAVLKHSTAIIDSFAGNDQGRLKQKAMKGKDSVGEFGVRLAALFTSAPRSAGHSQQSSAGGPSTSRLISDGDGGASDDEEHVDEDRHMESVGVDGPALLITVRDALDLEQSPEQHMSQLRARAIGSIKQQEGRKALDKLFPNARLLPFPEPGIMRGDAKRLCQLTPQQRGEDFNRALKGLAVQIGQIPLRRLYNDNTPLRGRLLCAELQRRLQLILEHGRIETQGSAHMSSEMADAKLMEQLEAVFEQAVTGCMADCPNATPQQLKDLLEDALQDKLCSLEVLASSSEDIVTKRFRPALEQRLRSRLDKAAEQRRNEKAVQASLRAMDFQKWKDSVNNEMEADIKEHFPAGCYFTPEHVNKVFEEDIVKKVVVRFNAQIKHSGAVADTFQGELNQMLVNWQEELLVAQEKANTEFLAAVKDATWVLEAREGMVLALGFSSNAQKDRLMGWTMGDRLSNLLHVFLAPDGRIITNKKKPEDGSVVAVLSVKDQKLWAAELQGKYWLPGTRYRIYSMPWELGREDVPLAAQFRVQHLCGTHHIQLHSLLSPGFVKREVCGKGATSACYKLGRTHARSHIAVMHASTTDLKDAEGAIGKLVLDGARSGHVPELVQAVDHA